MLLVVLTLLQSAYLLILERLYPYNTGPLSAYRLLADELIATRRAALAETAEASGRALCPSSVTWLSPEGDRALFYAGEFEANTVSEVLALAAHVMGTTRPTENPDAFSAMLSSEGLLLDLGRPLPGSLLCALQNCAGGDARPVRRLLLVREGDRLSLCLDADSGLLYETQSRAALDAFALCAETFLQATQAVPVAVAGRDGGATGLPEGSLYALERRTALPMAALSNPLSLSLDQPVEPLRDAALAVFSFNSKTFRRGRQEDGTQHFIQNNSSLSLSPDGRLTYRASEPRYGLPLSDLLSAELETYTLAQVISGGAELLERCLRPVLEGRSGIGLRYMGAEFLAGENRLLLYYDYAVCGLPLALGEGRFAAVLQYEMGAFVGATVLCRQIDLSRTLCYPSGIGALLRLAELSVGRGPVTGELIYPGETLSAGLCPTYRLEQGGEPLGVE